MTEKGYHGLLRFFSANAKHLKEVQQAWIKIALQMFCKTSIHIGGRLLVIVDGTKVAKRAKKMPEIIGLKDTSENTWIRGHQFEHLCMVAKGNKSFFPIPLVSKIIAGIEDEKKTDHKTTIDRCIKFISTYPKLRGTILVGDAWYSKSKFILGVVKHLMMSLITRRANNAIAHEIYIPDPCAPVKPGRKRKYGDKVTLKNLFSHPMETWTLKDNAENPMKVQGWSKDLLWQKIGEVVRFVGVSHPQKGNMILLSTDRNLEPQQIAQAYIYRFWIEVGFHNAKSFMGGFSYRFWGKTFKKLGPFPESMDLSTQSKEMRTQILAKKKMIEFFLACNHIAQGLLAYLAIFYGKTIYQGARFWMRTKRGDAASERMAATYMKILLRN